MSETDYNKHWLDKLDQLREEHDKEYPNALGGDMAWHVLLKLEAWGIEQKRKEGGNG